MGEPATIDKILVTALNPMPTALEIAHRAAQSWLDELDSRPVEAHATLAELKQRFESPLPLHGTAASEVVASLARDAPCGLLGNAGGRFFAWVIGGGVESALAADWLVATWDQNAAVYACSPAAAVIEEVAGEWIKELLDLPREASFCFTTGCQMAHMTALAAARHEVLRRRGWDVEMKGLCGAPVVRVITNEHRHGSVERAVRFLGFGRNSLVAVTTDTHGRIESKALQEVLDHRATPTIVVLNAGDLNIGACEQFAEVIAVAHAAGAWVHVDGAFGLFARASVKHRHLLNGIESADSWATDAHKWLNVPFDCGIAIVRNRDAHRAAMTLSASYLTAESIGRDQIDWNMEWSRRARGIPVYAALKELGREGVENVVDRCCEHCATLVQGIGALPGVKVLAVPTLNQGLLRFTRPGATSSANDAFTDETIRRINATGEAFFSGTTWQGQRAMRISVVNWRTSVSDVRRAIAAAACVLMTGSPSD